MDQVPSVSGTSAARCSTRTLGDHSVNIPAIFTSPIFDVVGVVLGMIGCAGFGFFYFNRNSALKRRVLPVFVTVLAAYAIAFPLSAGMDVPLYVLVIVATVVGAMAVVNYLRIGFCESCGRTVFGKGLARPEECSYCRAPFKRVA